MYLGSTGRDGSPVVEEKVASTGSFVTAWTSQHEGT